MQTRAPAPTSLGPLPRPQRLLTGAEPGGERGRAVHGEGGRARAPQTAPGKDVVRVGAGALLAARGVLRGPGALTRATVPQPRARACLLHLGGGAASPEAEGGEGGPAERAVVGGRRPLWGRTQLQAPPGPSRPHLGPPPLSQGPAPRSRAPPTPPSRPGPRPPRRPQTPPPQDPLGERPTCCSRLKSAFCVKGLSLCNHSVCHALRPPPSAVGAASLGREGWRRGPAPRTRATGRGVRAGRSTHRGPGACGRC